MKKARRAYTKYSQKFKKRVIMDMREHRLSCREAVRNWERKYLEEEEAGLMEESRKRTTKTERPNEIIEFDMKHISLLGKMCFAP